MCLLKRWNMIEFASLVQQVVLILYIICMFVKRWTMIDSASPMQKCVLILYILYVFVKRWNMVDFASPMQRFVLIFGISPNSFDLWAMWALGNWFGIPPISRIAFLERLQSPSPDSWRPDHHSKPLSDTEDTGAVKMGMPIGILWWIYNNY